MPRQMKEEEGKRYSLSAKTSLETNLALKAAAQKAGRSVSQEIEMRLERSLDDDKRNSDFVKNELVAEAMIGDAETAELVRAMTASISAAIRYTGGHWRDDIYTRAAVISAMTAARSAYFLEHKYKDDARDPDRDRLKKADSMGTLLGRMLAAKQLDPAIASWLEDMSATVPPLPENVLQPPEDGSRSKEKATKEVLQLSAPKKD